MFGMQNARYTRRKMLKVEEKYRRQNLASTQEVTCFLLTHTHTHTYMKVETLVSIHPGESSHYQEPRHWSLHS